MAAADAPPSLLDLPDGVISSIFERLSGPRRCSLMRTCKALHNSEACLSKITCVTLKLERDLHRQLTTIIRGCTIRKMVIEGSTYLVYPDSDESDLSDPEEYAEERPAPVASPLVAAFPHHLPLLSHITHLTLNGWCSLESCGHALACCLNHCLPNLRHLGMARQPEFDDEVAVFLSTLRHPLTSLHLYCRTGSMPTPLGPQACASLGALTSLQYLTLKADIESPLSGLAPSVRSVTLNGCCNLAHLPTKRMLPSLSHLHVDQLTYLAEGGAQAASALQHLTGVAFSSWKLEVSTESGRKTMHSFGELRHVLSSTSACIPAGLRALEFCRISIQPQERMEFAAYLPEVRLVSFYECIFAPDRHLVACVQGCGNLKDIAVVSLPDLKGGSLERYCEGILDACTAIHAILGEKGQGLTLRVCSPGRYQRRIKISHNLRERWLRRIAGSNSRLQLRV